MDEKKNQFIQELYNLFSKYGVKISKETICDRSSCDYGSYNIFYLECNDFKMNINSLIDVLSVVEFYSFIDEEKQKKGE